MQEAGMVVGGIAAAAASPFHELRVQNPVEEELRNPAGPHFSSRLPSSFFLQSLELSIVSTTQSILSGN